MELTQAQKAAQEMLNTVISKCWESDEFKQNLINHPVRTIEKVTGNPVNLADGVQIIVNDQTNTDYAYFNIPAKPNLDDMDLTDEQLEMVAGGDLFTAYVCFVAATVALFNMGAAHGRRHRE